MLATIPELYLRRMFHFPTWLPSITSLWVFLQAAWLKSAETESKAIYLYLSGLILEMLLGIPIASKIPHAVGDVLGFSSFALWLTAIFIFRDEMRKHFTNVDPRGLELNGFMTFFFNILYFQYWFREIYREQTEPSLSLKPSQG
jgi:hypothetical protein